MTLLEWAHDEALKTVYVGTCACMSGRGRTCSIHDAVVRGLVQARQLERARAVSILRERAGVVRATSGIAMESGHTSFPSMLVAAELSALVERIQAEDALAT
jgi:hypothetical protein